LTRAAAYVAWHWTVAALWSIQWLTSDEVGRWAMKNPFGLAPSTGDVGFGVLHAASGSALGVLSVGGWFVFLGSAGRRSGWWVRPSRIVHAVIVGLLAFSAISGWLASGGYTTFPHHLAATLFNATLIIHISAAALHALILRDSVIARVIPERFRP
jgi:hypothetical protein